MRQRTRQGKKTKSRRRRPSTLGNLFDSYHADSSKRKIRYSTKSEWNELEDADEGYDEDFEPETFNPVKGY